MSIPFSVFCIGVAFALSWYWGRSLKNGKILVGIRGGREAWLVRREDAVSYWIMMALVAVAVIGLLGLSVRGWISS
jgi:hypothetical protein